MPYKIHFAKALILVSFLILVAIFTFNKIIGNNRLEIFREYSHITLPPVYEIKRNTAGAGDNQTDVWLVFGFDEDNFREFLKQNKITVPAADITQPQHWLKENNILRRKTRIDSLTTVSEAVDLERKTLEFRYHQAFGTNAKK